MSCCGHKKNQGLSDQNFQRELRKNRWYFEKQEFNQLKLWFLSNATDGTMSKIIFREAMGFCSHGFSAYLFDRMFDVIDCDDDGIIKLKDYLNYMNILTHGNENERFSQSFQLLDMNKDGKITFDEFSEILMGTSAMFSTILNTTSNIYSVTALVKPDEWVINEIYSKLDKCSKGHFGLEEYIEALKENPKLFEWLEMTNTHFQHQQRTTSEHITPGGPSSDPAPYDLKPSMFLNFLNQMESTLIDTLGILNLGESNYQEDILERESEGSIHSDQDISIEEEMKKDIDDELLSRDDATETPFSTHTPKGGSKTQIDESPKNSYDLRDSISPNINRPKGRQILSRQTNTPEITITQPSPTNKNAEINNAEENKGIIAPPKRMRRPYLSPLECTEETPNPTPDKLDSGGAIGKPPLDPNKSLTFSKANNSKILKKSNSLIDKKQSLNTPPAVKDIKDIFGENINMNVYSSSANLKQYKFFKSEDLEEVEPRRSSVKKLQHGMPFKLFQFPEMDESKSPFGGRIRRGTTSSRPSGHGNNSKIYQFHPGRVSTLQSATKLIRYNDPGSRTAEDELALDDIVIDITNKQTINPKVSLKSEKENELERRDSDINSDDSEYDPPIPQEGLRRMQQELARTFIKQSFLSNIFPGVMGVHKNIKKSKPMEAKIAEESELEDMESEFDPFSPPTFGAQADVLPPDFVYIPQESRKSRSGSICVEDIKRENLELIQKLQLVDSKVKSILTYTRRCHQNIKQQINSEKQIFRQVAKEKVEYRTGTIHNIPKSDNQKNIILKRKKSTVGNKEEAMPPTTGPSGIIHFAHENFLLVFNMMVGIKKAVDSSVDFPGYTITKRDYSLKGKFYISPWSMSDVKGNKRRLQNCKFVDYAPQVYFNIRKIFGVKKDEYSKSLGPHQLLSAFRGFKSWVELCSTGKSGSFFYYTEDSKYMLKTVSSDEFSFLKRLLPNYYEYIRNNPDTLMTRFYGCHKMIFFRKKKTSKRIPFVIMNNVFLTNKQIHVRYDLKGSKIGRSTGLDAIGQKEPTIARKDLDFIDSKKRIQLDEVSKDKFLEQVKKDSKFFEDNKIIDYSLLLGVHFPDKKQGIPTPQPEESLIDTKLLHHPSSLAHAPTYRHTSTNFISYFQRYYGGINSLLENETYFFGIIDILTEYNTKKKAEHFFKSFKYGEEMSCIPPTPYSKRFLKFMSQIIS